MPYPATDCEKKQEALLALIERLAAEETAILTKQDALKKELYARFGDAINLEN